MDGKQAKIRQTSKVEEYINCFEQLSCQAHNWSDVLLVNTFIEGLWPEIQREVKARQPRTMIAAISLTRREEKRFGEQNYQKMKLIDKPTSKGSS
jgi:hypothetical protein